MTTPRLSPLDQVAALNDRCRRGLDRHARILVTRSCLARFGGEPGTAAAFAAQAMLFAAVRDYSFAEAEGRERDRGRLTIAGQEVRFRIDYYDRALEWASPDPTDPAVTTRVLTIMLPEDD